ncbi:hypothetical protein GCM10010329_24180 [Streptomyces spiroverticillatus]|uniref:Uncharacterized protein n=2 Tax=Streptomyces finlayi TaxID=67296 RepID=A0A918WUX9_9ACTN|nr:hypothetical protein GCM10010329_24180 [Streptomyces spiroverticillatus]GHC85994.1 hypothetical protein GCM10010334_16600 [Streptomyces finlayi]
MYDVHGNAVDEPDAATLRTLVVDGLADPEAVNPEVSLTHESGWSLTAYAGGLLLWENVEDEGAAPGTRDGVQVDEAVRLFGLLAEGEVGEVGGTF